MKQSSATQSLHLSFWGVVEDCYMFSLCLLVSTVFGTVSSLHPTSFLYLYTQHYKSINEVGHWDDTVQKRTQEGHARQY